MLSVSLYAYEGLALCKYPKVVAINWGVRI